MPCRDVAPINKNFHEVMSQFENNQFNSTSCVVTLTLGSQPRQGLAKVGADNEARESHFMLPGV